ncbi:hypothetical protein A2U01_0070812, partial [Trifolium medium]|nr:hypothetical protein [Trifolium medium]
MDHLQVKGTKNSELKTDLYGSSSSMSPHGEERLITNKKINFCVSEQEH